MSPLERYRAKRNFDKSPEPAGELRKGRRSRTRFVVQEHHARRLHWDFRLEKDGVLVSWAVPKGVPLDPRVNHLAVHVEDHPLSYIDFAGDIPAGQYGAGTVSIWDAGTYREEKFEPGEVKVVLDGARLKGRYVLFRTKEENWMIHRMDPAPDAEAEPMPERIEPMLAKLAAEVPKGERAWGFEFKWDGVRAICYVTMGDVHVQSRRGEDVTRRYPELRGLADALGSRTAVLDGEIIALDDRGRPSFERLQQRMGLNREADIRRARQEVPVYFMVFDALYAEGRSLLGEPYSQRRAQLDALELNGEAWQVPPWQEGGGRTMLEASRRQGLEGVVAKRLDSPYEPGRRSGAWLKIKNHFSQEFVIGGWLPGEGRRQGHLGALLVGHYESGRLRYAGKVGTGYTDRMLERLAGLLKPLKRSESPFEAGPRPAAGAIFVEPALVGDVEFGEWTSQGLLRHPSFKGLRDDKDPRAVMREIPS